MFDIEKLSKELELPKLKKNDVIVWVDNTESIFEDMDCEHFLIGMLAYAVKKIKRGNKTIYKRKSNKEVNT